MPIPLKAWQGAGNSRPRALETKQGDGSIEGTERHPPRGITGQMSSGRDILRATQRFVHGQDGARIAEARIEGFATFRCRQAPLSVASGSSPASRSCGDDLARCSPSRLITRPPSDDLAPTVDGGAAQHKVPLTPTLTRAGPDRLQAMMRPMSPGPTAGPIERPRSGGSNARIWRSGNRLDLA